MQLGHVSTLNNNHSKLNSAGNMVAQGHMERELDQRSSWVSITFASFLLHMCGSTKYKKHEQ